MIDIAHPLRVAYFTALNTVKVDGISVPAFDEIVPLNATIPTIRGAQCYVLILDQSEQEVVGNMCNDKENANITLKVVAKFPKGSGGKKLTEDISNEIQKIIRSNSFTPKIISNSNDWNIARITKVTAQNITEEGETQTAYTKNIIYQNKITLNH